MKPYQDHPIAAIFPLMLPAELQEMADDIKAHGLRSDIAIYEGKILDGRNRYRACALAGVTATTYVYAGDDPVGEVLSLNLHRRHLTAGQKAAIAADALPHFEEEARKRYESTVGRPSKESVEKIPQINDGIKSRDQAAAQVGVNPRYVSDAKKIKEESPETFEKLKSGEITMPEAKREALQKEPISPEEPATSPKSERPCDGMRIANKAISLLEGIADNDKELNIGYRHVKNWLTSRIK